MATIHFLNVLEGDCNIIEHDSSRVTVIDISNGYNDIDTEEELAVKNSPIRKDMFERTQVPSNKRDYHQKKHPDNPITYLEQKGVENIFRFIISHPDMDHLDGIKDFFESFEVTNVWDTNNNKEISDKANSGGYNMQDWDYYKSLRDGKITRGKRLSFYSGSSNLYYNEDHLQILSPTPAIIDSCNKKGNWNDSSYVLLFTPPKASGGNWKILFAGDSEDGAWEHILNHHTETITDIDILMAPHHGRDSNRNFDFLEVLNPKVTLFGNASSKHLAYSKYSGVKITNNQAGYIILDIHFGYIQLFVKNFEFARDFCAREGWDEPIKNDKFQAYSIGLLRAV